ncbi:hypothetical protein CF645_15720 [Burkholderia pseudomallei]|nr:hypothetical protein BHT10_14165 [Burkholderia pseudomallei]PNW97944.1 hypothetical protein CF640_05790 [Burkholderia pseudomallei]PNX21222.1 hypothetical protein CF645_15720 [Burkholderia pseudomallei]QGS90691.1 hypothetical protein R15_01385 [Burkholderia pseudomallei]QGT03112.1 hypothetical protein D286_01130 [Burkholderia pseudomallei]
MTDLGRGPRRGAAPPRRARGSPSERLAADVRCRTPDVRRRRVPHRTRQHVTQSATVAARIRSISADLYENAKISGITLISARRAESARHRARFVRQSRVSPHH